MKLIIKNTAILLFSLIIANANAVNLCTNEDSVNQCLLKYTPNTKQTEKTKKGLEQLQKEKSLLAQEIDLLKNVAGISFQNSRTASTLQSFLPGFSLLGVNGQNDDDNNLDLGLQYNFAFPSSEFGNNTQIELDLNESPSLFPMLESFFEGEQTLIDEAKRDINSFDEYTIAVSYAYQGRLFGQQVGRSFPIYKGWYKKLYHEVVSSQTVKEAENLTDKAFFKLLDIPDFPDSDDDAFYNRKIKDYTNPAQALDLIQKAGNTEKTYVSITESSIASNGLISFSSFVNNQPQLIFTLNQTRREGTVGPDTTTIGIKYEMGLNNLNTLMRKMKPDCFVATAMSNCLSSYRETVNSMAVEAKKAKRWSFSLEFSGADAFEYSASTGTKFEQESTKKYTAGVAYGRNLTFSDVEDNTRLDVSINYEKEIEGSTAKDDRLVGSILFVKKVKNVSIPFGLVYANRSEFLADTDKQLSARIGLQYDFSSLNDLL